MAIGTQDVKIQIEGITPLMVHRFTDAAQSKTVGGSAAHSRAAINGASSLPREVAAEHLYTEDGKPVIPGPNILSCLTDAGKFFKNGRSKITTMRSSLVPAGIMLKEIFCPIKPTKWEVDSRPVVVPATGGRIICHRPRFDEWGLSFTLEIDLELFDPKLVRELVDAAGKRIGLGAFRPARKGPFGRFVVTSWKAA